MCEVYEKIKRDTKLEEAKKAKPEEFDYSKVTSTLKNCKYMMKAWSPYLVGEATSASSNGKALSSGMNGSSEIKIGFKFIDVPEFKW